MNRKNEGKSTNISRKKILPLAYFKGKPKSNRSLTPGEDLLYGCAVSCSLLIKVENLKMTNLDYSEAKNYCKEFCCLQIWGKIIPDVAFPRPMKTIFS